MLARKVKRVYWAWPTFCLLDIIVYGYGYDHRRRGKSMNCAKETIHSTRNEDFWWAPLEIDSTIFIEIIDICFKLFVVLWTGMAQLAAHDSHLFLFLSLKATCDNAQSKRMHSPYSLHSQHSCHPHWPGKYQQWPAKFPLHSNRRCTYAHTCLYTRTHIYIRAHTSTPTSPNIMKTTMQKLEVSNFWRGHFGLFVNFSSGTKRIYERGACGRGETS